MTKKPGTSRRDFLKLALGGAAGLASFSALEPLLRLGIAQEGGSKSGKGKDRHYVVVYFAGGWDILVGLDPRDPAVFTDGNLNATRIQPGYERLRSPKVATTKYPAPAGSGPL